MLAILQGCISSRVFDYTLVSTAGGVDVSRLGEMKRGKEVVHGERKFVSAILVWPINSDHFDYDRAIQNTLNSVPGAVALLDVVIYQEFRNFIIFRETRHVVKGTPLIDPKVSTKTQNEASKAGHVQSFSQSGMTKRKVVKRIPKYVRK